MQKRISNLKIFEMLLLVAGAFLLGYATFKYASGRVYSHFALAKLQAVAAQQSEAGKVAMKSVRTADQKLWSPERIKAYQAALTERFDTPIATLRVQKIKLEVPVFNGTDEWVLNRGAGRIVGTTQVGQIGNIGIAGHRDGVFRGLKDVKLGDSMELDTADSAQIFVIDSIKIVTPNDVSILKNGPAPALTLVTCYPFYFFGRAPQRYIVHASLRGETNKTNAPARAGLLATASRTKEKKQ